MPSSGTSGFGATENGDTEVQGETRPTYTLSDDDVWKTIKVRVSFTDDRNYDETLASPGTRKVPAVPVIVASDDGAHIVVESTADEYFVLYVRPDLSNAHELPVLVTLGEEGTTTLTEELPPLPRAHYRAEKFLIADPADTDGDGIDDIAELADPVGMNPLNPAAAISFVDGALAVPDRETFEALAYKGNRISYHSYLRDLEFVNFYIVDVYSGYPRVYFINTNTHLSHPEFWTAIGRPGPSFAQDRELIWGEVIFHPNARGAGRVPGRLPFQLGGLQELLVRNGPS